MTFISSVANSPSSLIEGLDSDSMVYAGMALLEIWLNDGPGGSKGTLIYKVENPCASTRERPVIIAAAKETSHFIEICCDFFTKGKKELEESPLKIEYEDGQTLEFDVVLEMTQIDGKMKSIMSGLGGAYCTLCTTSPEDAQSIPNIRDGFPMNRTIESTIKDFELLAEPDEFGDLIVPRKPKDYSIRKGLTQKPKLSCFDVCKEMGTLHAWIGFLVFFLKLAYRINGNFRKKMGTTQTKAIEKRLEVAKKILQEKARRTLSLKLDEMKEGGNTNDGNTAKAFFSPMKREKVVNLYHAEDDAERIALRNLLKRVNVIMRVATSKRKIRTQKLQNYCTETNIKLRENFEWFKPIPPKVHGILAHLGERIDMNDGVGLGPISEEGLEASNKELRRGKAQFSRKDDLAHGLRDCWKRQFIKSDGIVNNFKKEILCTNCGDKTHFIRKCPELKSKDEEETLNEDEELIESFFLDD